MFINESRQDWLVANCLTDTCAEDFLPELRDGRLKTPIQGITRAKSPKQLADIAAELDRVYGGES